MTEEMRNIWFFVFTGDLTRDTKYEYQGVTIDDALLSAACSGHNVGNVACCYCYVLLSYT